MIFHPWTQTLGAWTDGALTGRRRDRVARHVATCPACRQKIRTLETVAHALGRRRADGNRMARAVIDALPPRPAETRRRPVAKVQAVQGVARARSAGDGNDQGFDLFPGAGVFASDRIELEGDARVELVWDDAGGHVTIDTSVAVGDLLRQRDALRHPTPRLRPLFAPATAWSAALALALVALTATPFLAPRLLNRHATPPTGPSNGLTATDNARLNNVSMEVDHSLVVSVPLGAEGLISFPGGSAGPLTDRPGLFMGTPRDVAAAEAASRRREQTELRRQMTRQGYHEVSIDLPPPLYTCMPKAIRLPNLEQPLFRKQPLLFTPREVTNVALGKPVTASQTAPIQGDLAMITDGRKDGLEGTYVELGPGPQFVQIDLGERHEIYAVVVWHYFQDHRAYKSVVVLTADDPDCTQNVTVIYNADYANALSLGAGTDKAWVQSHHGRLMVPPDQMALGRYVRLYSDGSTSGDTNEYIEVEVYGAPVE